MTLLEWPKGSGRIANYTKDEMAYVQRFVQQHLDGEITKEESQRQLAHCHDLKVDFGVDLIKDDILLQDKPRFKRNAKENDVKPF